MRTNRKNDNSKCGLRIMQFGIFLPLHFDSRQFECHRPADKKLTSPPYAKFHIFWFLFLIIFIIVKQDGKRKPAQDTHLTASFACIENSSSNWHSMTFTQTRFWNSPFHSYFVQVIGNKGELVSSTSNLIRWALNVSIDISLCICLSFGVFDS